MTGIETGIEQRESWRAARDGRAERPEEHRSGRAELHYGLLERVGWECG